MARSRDPTLRHSRPCAYDRLRSRFHGYRQLLGTPPESPANIRSRSPT